MSKKSYLMPPVVALFIWWCAILQVVTGGVRAEANKSGEVRPSGPLVLKREQMKTLFSSEDGQISAARVADAINASSYLLHFFTLEPNSLFLPALLHADMVFYVHTGSGKLSWTDEDELKSTEITRGDVFRLEQGSFFFLHSNLETETERQKLRIHAIFVDSNNEPATGPYSSIRDMVLGFDREVLKAAFKVPEEVIDDLMNGTSPAAIVHGLSRTKKAAFEMETLFVRNFLGTRSYDIFELNKKKSGAKLFNLFKADKDFENCNGWSTTVTRKKLSLLKGSNVGLFMVNLTAGSMMGPHWNPTATEIAVVLQGRGMVRVVCSSFPNDTRCRNTRFEVREGDVFVVPRFHPMAQISFNNGTLVFMGFSTSALMNHPQYLTGQASVFRTLDRDVLAMSFNITNTTLDQLLAPQHESVILGCVSCADEELRIMEEERERTRKEAREKEEEETRREEERKREEARKREEERKRKEEAEEAARKREEEAAKSEEEERRRKEEEEEAEARRKEEEEAARKREEGAAKREEDERMRKEEEAEAERKKEEEKREREKEKKREEEAARKEEEARERREEEEAARQREEEAARERREEEEAARQREEEAARKEEEERRRTEEEEEAESRRKEEERERREEEAAARQREEEATRKEEEERARREEEEQEEETQRRQQEQERRKQKQEEARKREEEEAAARQREEEKAKQREEERRREEQEQDRRRQEEQEATQRHQEQEARHREEQQEGRKSEGERAAEEERRREEEAQREEEERGGGQDGEYQRWAKILKKRLSV